MMRAPEASVGWPSFRSSVWDPSSNVPASGTIPRSHGAFDHRSDNPRGDVFPNRFRPWPVHPHEALAPIVLALPNLVPDVFAHAWSRPDQRFSRNSAATARIRKNPNITR